MTLRPVLLRTCVAFGACIALLASQSITAEIPQPVEHLVGRSLDASGTYAGPIDVVIGRWSTQEEFESVRKPIMSKNGPAAVLALLERVRIHAGYVLTPGIQGTGARSLARQAWVIDFAREVNTPQGRRIVVASQDHLPIGEFPRDAARGTAHGVDVLDIRFDAHGNGIAKLADASKVVFNKSIKTIEIDRFGAEPVRVTDVVKDPLQRKPVRTVVG
ncbi:MAG TPA: hypothetical protein VKD69_05580 [Vicinamibacterales bacterium]|nr:hypothetical protein [Vicinamibacterales bacterium]